MAIAPNVVSLGIVLTAAPHSARSLYMLIPIRDPAEKASMETKVKGSSLSFLQLCSCLNSGTTGLRAV